MVEGKLFFLPDKNKTSPSQGKRNLWSPLSYKGFPGSARILRTQKRKETEKGKERQKTIHLLDQHNSRAIMHAISVCALYAIF